jgi:hypothetical protein
MKSLWSIACTLGFIIFASEAALAISGQSPSIHGEQGYDVLEDVKHEIENISSHIELMRCQKKDELELLESYNERGIRYFCIGLLEYALDDFNHVLNVLYNRQKTTEPSLALALWGRMLCHAYQNREEETFRDLDLFQSQFLLKCSPCMRSQPVLATLPASSSYGYYVHPISRFVNPNEKLSPERCKQRVKGTADVMRLLIVRIPNASLVGAIGFAISQLEDVLYDCCYRNHWTDCLNPITDAFEYMKRCMDKGVAIAPRIVFPGR